MLLHKRAELDTVNPPGQIVNPVPNFEKPLGKHIEDFMTQREVDLTADNASKTTQIDAQALEIERLRGQVRELTADLVVAEILNRELPFRK